MDLERFCGEADPEHGTNCLRKPGHAGAHKSLRVEWDDEAGERP